MQEFQSGLIVFQSEGQRNPKRGEEFGFLQEGDAQIETLNRLTLY